MEDNVAAAVIQLVPSILIIICLLSFFMYILYQTHVRRFYSLSRLQHQCLACYFVATVLMSIVVFQCICVLITGSQMHIYLQDYQLLIDYSDMNTLEIVALGFSSILLFWVAAMAIFIREAEFFANTRGYQDPMPLKRIREGWVFASEGENYIRNHQVVKVTRKKQKSSRYNANPSTRRSCKVKKIIHRRSDITKSFLLLGKISMNIPS